MLFENILKKRDKKCGFCMITNSTVNDNPKLRDVLIAVSVLGDDPDNFLKIVPDKKINNSVYMTVSHPLVGIGDENKYLMEIRFERDCKNDFRHFEILTGDKRYVVSVLEKYLKKMKIPNLKTWTNVTLRFKRNMCNSDVIEAHKFSSNHREKLMKDEKCGCFYCGHIFSPSEIADWIDDPMGTAICPYCGIDAVLGESCGYPITPEFLFKMKKYWFF